MGRVRNSRRTGVSVEENPKGSEGDEDPYQKTQKKSKPKVGNPRPAGHGTGQTPNHLAANQHPQQDGPPRSCMHLRGFRQQVEDSCHTFYLFTYAYDIHI